MDLQQENLGLSGAHLEELRSKLNIIVNAAGTVEFDTRLDIATDINVRGPLLLMKLAATCQKFEAFCQVSTLFALSDKLGFIDEKIYESGHDWHKEYQKISTMNASEIISS